MKRVISIALCLVMVVCSLAVLASCGEKYEIAVVTDVGQLMDKGFNQGTYEGVKAYAEANNISYKYYQPANGSEATDDDRVAAMKQAVRKGAKIIVAPGYLQATAMAQVAAKNPDVKFVFVDGFGLKDPKTEKDLTNVTAIVYKEQESGYMAGYAAVMDGYTKLGFTGGGGGSNPACNRFGYGFVQGAEDAAKAKGIEVDIKFSFKYGTNFSASNELQTQIAGWYAGGTEVVFACGGSMFQSVKAAAAEYKEKGAKIIGVDVDQSGESELVITSAIKGLSVSVQKVLAQIYADKWDSELGGKKQNLGAADDATGLPTGESWRLINFTEAQYNELFTKIKNGTITPDAAVPEDCNNEQWLTDKNYTKVTIQFEK